MRKAKKPSGMPYSFRNCSRGGAMEDSMINRADMVAEATSAEA